MTNPVTPTIFTDSELTAMDAENIEPAPAAEQPSFDLSAEFQRYQDRECALLEQIDLDTAGRKQAAATIAKARDELRMVRRLLSATKPRKAKS